MSLVEIKKLDFSF